MLIRIFPDTPARQRMVTLCLEENDRCSVYLADLSAFPHFPGPAAQSLLDPQGTPPPNTLKPTPSNSELEPG